jgi:transposase
MQLELVDSLLLHLHGGIACPFHLALAWSSRHTFTSNCRPLSAPARPPKLWSFAAASSCVPPIPITPPTSKSPTNSLATATPSASGASALPKTVWRVCKTLLGPVAPGLFPPQDRLAVLTIASEKTADHDCPATRWTLDDLAFQLVNEAAAEAMHRSTIWRILAEADLKPHQSVYWLNSHDPDFDAKAKQICGLYVQSPVLRQQGELLICTDEKTGMQILERKYPTQLARPGHPEKREHEYIRHGTRALIASFVVPTGELIWDLGLTRTSDDFAAHLLHVLDHCRDWPRLTWVMDNLNTHWSLQACEVLAAVNDRPFYLRDLKTGQQRRKFLSDPDYAHRFVFTPKHGSWLNQVELWFSVLARRFLQRGDFASAEQFEERLRRFVEEYNERHAHPYRWTYTGEPLVRGTPFSQTQRQRCQGRAWFGRRPQRFDRWIHPPRPYKKRAAA